MNKFLSTLAAVCLASLTICAQNVQLRIDSLMVADAGAEVCVGVIADSLPDVVGSMQFSVVWPVDSLDFERVDFGDNPLGLSSNDAMLSGTAGQFNVAFISATGQAFELAPMTTLFNLCFTTEDREEADATLTFDGSLAPEFGSVVDFSELPFVLINGRLNYTTEEGQDTTDTGGGGDTTTTSVFHPELAEPDWAEALNIYPNPYKRGPLSISGDGLPAFDEVEILDMQGRRVRRFAGNARRFTLEALPAGEYTLRIRVGQAYVSRLLLRQ